MSGSKAAGTDLPHWVNEAQAQVLRSYCNGEFASLLEEVTPARFGSAIAACGDGLLRFLITELATDEGTDGLEEALKRVMTAVDELRGVADALASQVYSKAAG